MSHIYQHKTLGRPVDSRKNKGIGEIAVPRKSNINTANKKNPTVNGIYIYQQRQKQFWKA